MVIDPLHWITDAKTQAGVRRLEVPPQLQAHLQRIVRGKGQSDRLFGPDASRYWVLRSVQRICRAAGVPTVPAHGLRGTHATLAVSAGATSHVVAAALGHESFSTTARHYAKADAIEGAQQERVLEKFTVVHGHRTVRRGRRRCCRGCRRGGSRGEAVGVGRELT